MGVKQQNRCMWDLCHGFILVAFADAVLGSGGLGAVVGHGATAAKVGATLPPPAVTKSTPQKSTKNGVTITTVLMGPNERDVGQSIANVGRTWMQAQQVRLTGNVPGYADEECRMLRFT